MIISINASLEENIEKGIRTYETKENSLKALNHILKQYLLFKNRKIDPRKPLRDALDLIQNTLYYDKEFHQFALQNLGYTFIRMKK